MTKETMQYAKMGSALYPCGETIPRLSAGFYNMVHGMFGWGISPADPVSDELIDIPGTPADEIIQDINQFLATKDRYRKAGLTHKRGYLFYGPPGTGKTSMGLMIGRRFIKDADGVVFYIPNAGYLGAAVEVIREVEAGRPAMFLMEEADSFLNDTRALSILDGELTLNGAVFVAMTNYKEKMPPRIANRPGRFDRVTYVGAPPYAVQVEYFRRLLSRLGEDHPTAARDIANALEGLPISMAHLREAFIAHVLMGVDPGEVRRRFEQMAKEGDPVEELLSKPATEDEDENLCIECAGQLYQGTCTDTDCVECPDYEGTDDE